MKPPLHATGYSIEVDQLNAYRDKMAILETGIAGFPDPSPMSLIRYGHKGMDSVGTRTTDRKDKVNTLKSSVVVIVYFILL